MGHNLRQCQKAEVRWTKNKELGSIKFHYELNRVRQEWTNASFTSYLKVGLSNFFFWMYSVSFLFSSLLLFSGVILEQWFSKSGPLISSISITREFIIHAKCWDPLHTSWMGNWSRVQPSVFQQVLWVILKCTEVWQSLSLGTWAFRTIHQVPVALTTCNLALTISFWWRRLISLLE